MCSAYQDSVGLNMGLIYDRIEWMGSNGFYSVPSPHPLTKITESGPCKKKKHQDVKLQQSLLTTSIEHLKMVCSCKISLQHISALLFSRQSSGLQCILDVIKRVPMNAF